MQGGEQCCEAWAGNVFTCKGEGMVLCATSPKHKVAPIKYLVDNQLVHAEGRAETYFAPLTSSYFVRYPAAFLLSCRVPQLQQNVSSGRYSPPLY